MVKLEVSIEFSERLRLNFLASRCRRGGGETDKAQRGRVMPSAFIRHNARRPVP